MSTGLKANNDGSAAIQVGGTDYIQISSTGNVTIPQSQTISGNLTVTGTITAGAGTPYVIQSYTSPATWTKPTGLKAVRVTVLGGGGAGGAGIVQSPGLLTSRGGGGGSGAYAQAYYDAPAIPGPLTITAGASTNSFGALVSCTGGAAGGNGVNGNGGGGAGGSYTPSPATMIGANGFSGASPSAANNVGFNNGDGSGANTFAGLGFGGLAGVNPFPATTTPGSPGLRYGSGGGGGMRTTPAPSGTTAPGGTGQPGFVIVEEFY